jgi:signal transduction histidine kinase
MTTSTSDALDSGRLLLVDAVQQLSMARTFGEVQEIVRTTARELCGADGATLVLRDGEHCYYADEDAISPLWKGQRFPLHTCISGWAMHNREAVAIEDIYADDRIPHDAYRPTFVKSLAMVPIRRLDPIGAIGNYWARHRMPSREQVAMLQALADSTAVAMENVRVWSELEERVADRTTKLEHALQLNERVLGTLAHEVRNCLTGSVGMLELALASDDDQMSDRNRGRVQLALSASADAVRVVDDQLTAAKERRGELRALRGDVDVTALLDELEQTYLALRRNDLVAVVVDAPPDGTVIVSDRHLLMQALRNLVSNALKYTDAGEVRVSAEPVDGGRFAFRVSDTGTGIAAAEQEAIFEEWVQGEGADGDERAGVGLGLPFVRRIAHLLGGELALESELGRGSTFTLTVSASA